MSKFDSREENQNWKARNALKRFSKTQLDRSDKAREKKESEAGKKNGGA